MAPTAQGFGREAFEFIEDLDRLCSPGAVVEAMHRVVAQFGFEGSVITGLRAQPGQSFNDLVLVAKWPAEFQTVYFSRGLPSLRSERQACPSLDPSLRMERVVL
jgi:Autoinducer binding domain